jgi:TonB-linked SusC/RagA family outer membrane protein
MRKIVSLLTFLLLFTTMAWCQGKISGTVRDQNGDIIPFATINVKGTKVTVAADANANFSIPAKNGDVLVITAVGVQPTEVTVGNSTTVSVVMTRTTGNISDVVVTTALGIKREAKSLGYSTATVNSDALNIAKPVNVAQGLMGQIAGAQISIINNGVNPEVRVQLRGERHINSDNQPLLIVDGMESRSDYLATLNPEDVDNVSILKGASAAALYGSEASNGVMIITTKRGTKSGKPSISLTQTQTFENMAYFPALQNTYSGYGGESGTFFAGTPYEFQAINPYTGLVNSIPFENQQYGPAYDGNPALGYIGSPDENGDVYKTPFKPLSTDPRRAFFVTGITTQSDASISSGDNQNSSFIGLQYVNVKGTTPKDVSQRANVRFAGKRTFGIFSADYTMSYSNTHSNVVGGDFTLGWPLYWTLLNTLPNVPINDLKDWQDPNSFANASKYYNAYYINPWWQVDNSRDDRKTDNFQGVLNLNLKAAEWLNFSYRLGAQVSNVVGKDYRDAVTFTPYAQSDPWGESGTPKNGNIAGAVWDQTILYRRIQQDIFATLTHKFGDIAGTLILGNTIWERKSSSQTQSVGATDGAGGSPQSQKSNLSLPGIYSINYYAGIPGVGSYLSRTRLIGGFADLSLSYNDYLFLHGNYRRDYSSLLAPGNNSYDVYGVDASWIFTDNLPFLKSSKTLSYGKLRAAYSVTGQITLNPYQTVNTFNVAGGYPYGGLTALALNGQYNNPANVPEKTKEKEVGLELGLLNNRISAGATYYFDDNLNQLFPVSVSSSTGFSAATVNAARTVSKGWEFDLKVSPVRSKDVHWDLAGNLAIQTTTVKTLYQDAQNFGIGNANEAIVGMTFPQLYVNDLKRDSATGKVIVDATTGLPTKTSTLYAVGRTTPKYILGLTSTVTYKNFSLQVIADYRGGYVFYNNAEQNLDFTGASVHTTLNGRQNFIFPNSVVDDGTGKYVPNTNVYTQDGNIGFWAYSDYRGAGTSYVENAAAWKVRTISLSYDFTSLLQRYRFIKGVKLTALCNNVLMFRPSENDFTDPEFNNGNVNGLGYNTYYQLPPTRQYSFILNVKF